MMMLIIILAAAAVAVFLFFTKRKSEEMPGQNQGDSLSDISSPEDKSALRNIADFINEKDPGFSAAVFTEKISNLFIRVCNSIEDKNTLIIKPYFADSILLLYDREIEKDRQNGLTHIFDKLTAAGVKTQFIDIIAEIRSRMTDYKIDSAGKPVGGGMNTEKFITSEWTLERNTSEKTSDKIVLNAQNCPNCGAAININNSSVCEYCGCVLNTDSFNWVVTNIKSISRNEVNI